MYTLKLFLETCKKILSLEGLGLKMHLYTICFISFYLNYVPSMIKDDYILGKCL